MRIRIKSKRDGFWRAGVQHFKTPVVHDAGRFSREQLKAIQEEPMLHVETLEDVPGKDVPEKETPAKKERKK